MTAPGTAFITGISGQDGSYLAELLLDKGYEVHGMVRRASTEKFERIEHLRDKVTLHQGDLLDQRSLVDALRAARPEEIYNLAAMSFVAVSWIQPTLTAEFTGVGVTRMLEAMREARPGARFYQASSSEMFGKVRQVPQNEATPFYPRSPYGVAKAYGHHITVNYRESYELHLGNLDAERDWGYAKDYVEAMWLMLQQKEPDDYVIASGVDRSVRDLVQVAFQLVGLEWEKYVEVDQAYMRPADVPLLRGDPSKARARLGWQPRTSFEAMIREMLEHDLGALGVDARDHLRLAQPEPR